MSNTQFYIGIAIPSVLILLGWLHQNTRFSDLRGDVRDIRGEMAQLRVDINHDMVRLHERVAVVEERRR